MADIASGLTEGFPDVNTPDGFAAALAEKVGAEVPEDVATELRNTDTSVASGLTEGPPSPRSEETPAAEGETKPDPEEGQSDEAETPALDAAVQEYIASHGGTPEHAISVLYNEFTNGQQLIGRQGNELGTLKQRLDALEHHLATAAEPEERFDAPLPTSQANEELETFFEERGPQGAMNWIVENRPDLIEDAIKVWGDYDEVAATRFATRYDRFLEEESKSGAQAQTQSQQGEDPFLQAMKEQAAFTAAVEQARAASGLTDEEWKSVQPFVLPALEDDNTSVLIKRAIAQPQTVAEQVEGMKALFQIARANAMSDATSKATAAASASQEKDLATRKANARVATGSLAPAKKGQSGDEEGDREERISRFKQQLLTAETTDVASGLTFGKQ